MVPPPGKSVALKLTLELCKEIKHQQWEAAKDVAERLSLLPEIDWAESCHDQRAVEEKLSDALKCLVDRGDHRVQATHSLLTEVLKWLRGDSRSDPNGDGGRAAESLGGNQFYGGNQLALTVGDFTDGTFRNPQGSWFDMTGSGSQSIYNTLPPSQF
jgi:hypothetical protein